MDPVLWTNIMDDKTIIQYLIYHDCGKPYCMEIDDEGRRHFPCHAAISQQTWLSCGGDDATGRLIAMDMDLHLMKPGQEEPFSKRIEACTLIIAALCEIHSNAKMFGGIDSTSFKIKWKHLNKFATRILNLINQKG